MPQSIANLILAVEEIHNGKDGGGLVNPQSFDISIARNEHSQIVSLSGEIDFAASLDLDPLLEEIVNDCDNELLFDLSKVTFIDSEGIKALLSAFGRMREKHQNARIIQCSPLVSRVLKLAGVSEILNIEHKTPPGSDLSGTKPKEHRVLPLNWVHHQR